jgi:hypothetical protein
VDIDNRLTPVEFGIGRRERRIAEVGRAEPKMELADAEASAD